MLLPLTKPTPIVLFADLSVNTDNEWIHIHSHVFCEMRWFSKVMVASTFFFGEESPFLALLQNLANKCSPDRFVELLANKLTLYFLVSIADCRFAPHRFSSSLCELIASESFF